MSVPVGARRFARAVVPVAGLLGVALIATACTASSNTADHAGTTGSAASTSSTAGAQPSTSPASGTPSSTGTSSSAPSASVVAEQPIELTASPATKSGVNPTAPVTVHVSNGVLTSVHMLSSSGADVTGAMSADRTSWHATEDLGYSKTYRLVAHAADSTGEHVRALTTRFSTLTPANMTMPYLQRIGGYGLDAGATYGVAIVPIVHFDEPITDEAAAQRTLSVTTSPHVDGSWYWADNQNVHFRPKNYWPSGTKVTIAAKVYGQQVSPGLYGQSDVSTSFVIGRKQLTVADDNSPQIDKVRIYNASGKVLRTMNTSMGKHGGETVKGQWINFYTLDGDYTVIAHENPAIMSSASYGLPVSQGGYAPFPVPYSTKISVDGIYLHEYNMTEYDQDHGYDVSEGCLNLVTADAAWYFAHSMIGDPVIVHGAKGAPMIQVWQGGDWSVPWKTWVAGSAG